MIVCPNCNHSNPDGAQACEACYTPLPGTTSCPNCGASVQTDATFCGQCGSNLRSNQTETEAITTNIDSGMPDLMSPEPLVQPEPLVVRTAGGTSANPPDPMSMPIQSVTFEEASVPSPVPAPEPITSEEVSVPLSTTPATPEPAIELSSIPAPPPGASGSSKTQLQQQTAKLLHVQTNRIINLPQNLSVIHIGKSNDRIPPDVDVSGFPNSEIVSRIHADIRVEGDAHYIEDVGSSNGTYINNLPLLPGNRHRLRAGDRIALGKGDLVTLIFQVS